MRSASREIPKEQLLQDRAEREEKCAPVRREEGRRCEPTGNQHPRQRRRPGEREDRGHIVERGPGERADPCGGGVRARIEEPHVDVEGFGREAEHPAELAAAEHAQELIKEHGYTYIPPFDDIDVVAGQGTIGVEILRQHSGPIDAVFVAIGGGGLISGVAAYIKAVRPEIKVIGVQMSDSDAMVRSVKAGKRITLPLLRQLLKQQEAE